MPKAAKFHWKTGDLTTFTPSPCSDILYYLQTTVYCIITQVHYKVKLKLLYIKQTAKVADVRRTSEHVS